MSENEKFDELNENRESDSGLTAKVPQEHRRIKSFVSRATRMSKGQQQAMDNLGPTYCIPFQPEPYELRQQFPKGDIILEIGFGMGTVTSAIADRKRDTNYLGVEVHKPGVGKLLLEIERLNLENVRIIHFDAVRVLEEMIPDETFSGVHIFFPDPWQKKKHNKRRLVQTEFINLLMPKLKKGGYIYCVTDWEEYSEQMLEVLTGIDGLVNPHDDWADKPIWRPETKFERKGLNKNHIIREVYFTKK